MRSSRIRRFALIGVLLLIAAGTVFWFRLPTMLERRLVNEFAEAGFPGASLRVASVGIRRLEIRDLTATNRHGRVALAQATVRYDPWMLLGSRVRSMRLDRLQIDLNLEFDGTSEETPAMDMHALQDRLTRVQPQFPMQALVVDDGQLRLQRNGRELVLLFSANLTNDTTQIRATIETTHPACMIEGRFDRRDGLHANAELGFADDWRPWSRLLLPESWHPNVDPLPLSAAKMTFDLRLDFGQVGMLNFRGDVDDGPLAGAYLQIEATATNWTRVVPGITGNFHVGGVRFDEFEPPLPWTGNQACRISGGLSVSGRFGWDQLAGLDVWPELAMALDRLEMVDLGLIVDGIHGAFSGAISDSAAVAGENLLRVDLVRYGEFAMTDLTLRAERLGRSLFEFELINASTLEGHLRVPPFRWDAASKDLDAVLELDRISLTGLVRLLPQFDGEIEGAIDGRVPVRFHAGRFSIGSSTLRLDRSRPARLRYPADGLLTKGASPGSDRYQQLEMIEDALEDLRLEELAVELLPADQPQTPVRLRLEGTFSSPKAIIPVKFNLNLNGDLEEVLRLLSRGEIELTL